MALGNLKSIVKSNVDNFTSDLEGKAKSFGNNLVNNALQNALGGGAASVLQALLGGPSSQPSLSNAVEAKVKGAPNDWRVRLSIPSTMDKTGILRPLDDTNGLVFPYTPTILIQHSANYDAMQPTHSNYPFPAYQNSQIDDIVITGDFFCENAVDAQYWVATLHYLRSVTKMAYGQSTNAGSPPPLVFLNGYGDFVFPNVPVIIKTFSVDLPTDVDYIKTQADGKVTVAPDGTTVDGNYEGWAPVQSQVMVTVQPVYSRARTSQFSLDKFVKGDYLDNGGFI
jgi:hypothetical protein